MTLELAAWPSGWADYDLRPSLRGVWEIADLEPFPAQAHPDPPRLRLFTDQMWQQLQRKLETLGLSPKPKPSGGEGDKPKRRPQPPSALTWELVWRRRG